MLPNKPFIRYICPTQKIESNIPKQDAENLRLITYRDNKIKCRTTDNKSIWIDVSVIGDNHLPNDISIEKKFLIYLPEIMPTVLFNEDIQPKIMWLDIETNYRGDDNAPKLIIAATTYINGKYTYFSGTEKEIVKSIIDQEPDLVVGWNLKDFDWSIIRECCQKYGIIMPKIIPIDYDDIVRGSMGKEFRSFKLEDVAQDLLGYGKIDLEGKWPVELSSDKLREYNINDVKLMVDIEKKYGCLNSRLNIQFVAKCFLDDVWNTSKFLDYLICRKALKRNMHIPENHYDKETNSYAGAYVYAEPGIYKDCIMPDVVSLYPSIIIAYNIGPDTLGGKDLEAANGATFAKEPIGIYAEIEKEMWTKRMTKKEAMKKETDPVKKEKLNIEQNALKVCLNALYGLTGAPFYRFYEPQIAEAITKTGVKLINTIKDTLNENGYKVVQVDTDGLTCVLNGKTAEETMDFINYKLQEISNNLNWTFRMDNKGIVDTVIVLKKKKYCYRLKGSSEINFVGIDVIRSDISDFSKKYVLDFINKIFDGQDIKDTLKDIKIKIKKEIKNVDPTLIGVPKAIRKDIDSYKNDNPWVIGAKLCKELFGQTISRGDKPLLLYIKPFKSNDTTYYSLSFLPNSITLNDLKSKKVEIDYDKMLIQTIWQKLYIMVEWTNMTWEEFQSIEYPKLDRWF